MQNMSFFFILLNIYIIICSCINLLVFIDDVQFLHLAYQIYHEHNIYTKANYSF